MMYLGKCFKGNNFVYIFMPKNASQSFRNCGLFPNRATRAGDPELVGYSQKNNMNVPKICIFREPVSRFISMFTYSVKMRLKSGHKIEVTIPRLLGYLSGAEKAWGDVTAPQYKYLEYINCNLEDIDVIMTVETIEKDFQKFKEKYNLKNIDLDWKNKSVDSDIKSLVYDDEDILNRINKLYKKDIELYNKVKKIKNDKD